MDTTASENSSWLRVRFAARLLAARPVSVLDVGAGQGGLLATLRAAGVRATGCEFTEQGVAGLVADGFDAQRADATALPFDDGAFDWVAMRHVPHHLSDPAAGVREALRVARRGFLVAEPWYDEGLGCQRAALAAERWLKEQQRRAGMVHGDNIAAARLIEFAGVRIESPGALVCEVAHHLCLRRRPTDDLVVEATPWLAALEAEDPARARWTDVLGLVARDGCSWNGSAVIAFEKLGVSAS